MSAPVFVRDLTEAERHALSEAARSENAFTRCRAHVLRFSQHRLVAPKIAEGLGCAHQTVLNVIHDFNERGLESLTPQPKAAPDARRIFDEANRQKLMHIAHQSPRAFGKPRSEWSLEGLAEVAFEEGLTERQVSHETVRQAILAMGVSWQRAKHWIESPDPQYALKKTA